MYTVGDYHQGFVPVADGYDTLRKKEFSTHRRAGTLLSTGLAGLTRWAFRRPVVRLLRCGKQHARF